MSVNNLPSFNTDRLELLVEPYNSKSFQGLPTTNLISSTGLDASVLGGYPLLTVSRVADPESFSGWAMEQQIQSTSINGSSRATFGDATSIPTSGNAFVSVYAKQTAGTTPIIPKVYSGVNWYNLDPLDGGSVYLSFKKYRRFGAYVALGTGSGGPNPAFSMTHNALPTTADITRWHSPQVELLSSATPFVAGNRSAIGAIKDVSGKSRNLSVGGTLTLSNNLWSVASNGYLYRSLDFLDSTNSPEITFNLVINLNWGSVTGYKTIMGMYEAGFNKTLALVLNSGNTLLEAEIRDDTTATVERNIFQKSMTAYANTNVLITYTFNRAVHKLYINGSLSNTVTGTKATLPSWTRATGGFAIAENIPDSRLLASGAVGHASVYSRALSDTEIYNNYLALKTKYGI